MKSSYSILRHQHRALRQASAKLAEFAFLGTQNISLGQLASMTAMGMSPPRPPNPSAPCLRHAPHPPTPATARPLDIGQAHQGLLQIGMQQAFAVAFEFDDVEYLATLCASKWHLAQVLFQQCLNPGPTSRQVKTQTSAINFGQKQSLVTQSRIKVFINHT
jgi:hypothetical protein